MHGGFTSTDVQLSRVKYLRIAGRVPPEVAPEPLRVLTASEHVREARLLGWNLADDRGLTGLFVVDGDREAVREAFRGAPAVANVETVPGNDDAFYLLATLEADANPLLAAAHGTVSTDGVVVVKPLVYRDGAVRGRIVGEDEAISAIVDLVPDAVDLTVHEVGERGFVHDATGARLSPRQREALSTALELGYYDFPREVTHEDVADAIDCAPSTASEHLRKAEAKLVRAALSPGDR